MADTIIIDSTLGYVYHINQAPVATACCILVTDSYLPLLSPYDFSELFATLKCFSLFWILLMPYLCVLHDIMFTTLNVLIVSISFILIISINQLFWINFVISSNKHATVNKYSRRLKDKKVTRDFYHNFCIFLVKLVKL